MGLGIRMIEQANVWQILFYRSIALASFLFCIISYRSGFKPVAVIRRSGLAGVIGGIGLVFAFATAEHDVRAGRTVHVKPVILASRQAG